MAIAGYAALLTFVAEYWIGAYLRSRFGIDAPPAVRPTGLLARLAAGHIALSAKLQKLSPWSSNYAEH